ncbi:MAG: hypothetical protein LBQ06_08130, partial [Frankiaceae bacterium]|jgi:oxygen-dependent protoporphyrinogen oxidase|nr:hypothetical protein [Frankiaceae bacterium]
VVIAVPGPAAAALLRPLLGAGASGAGIAGEAAGGNAGEAAGGNGAGRAGEDLDALGNPQTTDVVLATLVLDEPQLDGAPRGTGMLVSRRATDVRAKALTHATAKWPWLAAAAGPGRHVVRLSYGRAEDADPGGEARDGDGPGGTHRLGGTQVAEDPQRFQRIALADAATMLGVSLDPARVQDFAIQHWRSVLPRPVPGHAAKARALRDRIAREPGLAITGAWISGNGLVAVSADARAAAADLAG